MYTQTMDVSLLDCCLPLACDSPHKNLGILKYFGIKHFCDSVNIIQILNIKKDERKKERKKEKRAFKNKYWS